MTSSRTLRSIRELESRLDALGCGQPTEEGINCITGVAELVEVEGGDHFARGIGALQRNVNNIDLLEAGIILQESFERNHNFLKRYVCERRDANKIYYMLVEDRLALCLGRFVSAVCPDQVVLRHRRKQSGRKESTA